MKSLQEQIKKEEKATVWFWDSINSLSAQTNCVYEYEITNDGYGLDSKIAKKNHLPFGEILSGDIMYQECKVRDINSTDFPTLFLEKKKALKLLEKKEGNLYTNFCKDVVVTFKITTELLNSCKQTEILLPKTSSIDLNNKKEKKEVYLLPVELGSKKSYKKN